MDPHVGWISIICRHYSLVADPAEFDEGNGISATLAEHSALWHKACRLHFYTCDLERIAARKKQKLAVESEQPTELVYAGSPVKRRSLTTKSSQQHICIFVICYAIPPYSARISCIYLRPFG